MPAIWSIATAAPYIPDSAIVVTQLQTWAHAGDTVVRYVPDKGMRVKDLGEDAPEGIWLLSRNQEFPAFCVERLGLKGIVVEVRTQVETRGMRANCELKILGGQCEHKSGFVELALP